MSKGTDMPVAALVGNGLSLAAHPDLGIAAIAEEVVNRIRQSAEAGDADRVAVALERVASATNAGDPMKDFEVLVGAFDADGSYLERLRQLSEAIEPDANGLPEAFEKVAKFSERMWLRGMSHVLQVITERSKASHPDSEPIDAFVASLREVATGRLTIANLNYDTLLLASLMKYDVDFCDMAHGFHRAVVTFEDGEKYDVHQLRETANFHKKTRLLGLHGSSTWWKEPRSGKVYKFPIDALRRRSESLWEWLRSDEAESELWLPQVVLANQTNKAGRIAEYPFSLGYEEFGRALGQSDRWLIVGYSFRDEPVNEMLRAAFMKKTNWPRVLVVTLGEAPSQEQVEHALGWAATDGNSGEWLTISRVGVLEALGGKEWNKWSGAEYVTTA